MRGEQVARRRLVDQLGDGGVVARGPGRAVRALEVGDSGHGCLLPCGVCMGGALRARGAAHIGRTPYPLPISRGQAACARAAWAAASARLRTPSLERMRLTWWPAVFSLMNSVCAIRAFDMPIAEQPEHLLLARGELAVGAGARRGAGAEVAQHRGGGVHRARGAELLEGGERRARLVARELRRVGGQRARELEARLAGVERHREAAERGERPARRARRPRCGAPPPAPRARRRGPRAPPTRRIPELRGELGELAVAAASAPSTSPQARRASTSGASSCVARIASSSARRQAALEQRGGDVRPALGDAQLRERAQRRRVLLAPGEQLLGLRQAALADAQLGHRGDGRRAQLRDECRACAASALSSACSASGQRPVASSTSAWTVRQAPSSGVDARASRAKSSTMLAPLRRALPFARVHAGRDQVAVRLAERVHVAHAPGGGGGHRLLEQLHAGLAAPGADLRPAEQAQREDLEVGRTGLARDRHRPPACSTRSSTPSRVAGPLDRDPAVPGAAADALDARARRAPASRAPRRRGRRGGTGGRPRRRRAPPRRSAAPCT